MKTRLSVQLILLAVFCSQSCFAQNLHSVTAENVITLVTTEAELVCTVAYNGTNPPDVTIAKAIGSHSDARTTVADGSVTLTLTSATSSDSGEYVCNATISTTGETEAARFTLTVMNFALLQMPTDMEAQLGSSATFQCVPNAAVPSEATVTWFKDDVELDSFENQLSLMVSNVGYGDMGTYRCVAELNGEDITESGQLTIEGYRAPYVAGTYGDGAVSTDDTTIIECPVTGTATPILHTWEDGDGNIIPAKSTTGPFVNSLGELDLSNADADDSGFYTCTGRDAAGNTASQRFNVIVEEDDDDDFTEEWYFILIVCVVGALLIAAVVLLVWFIVANRKFFIRKETKHVRVKYHQRKPRSSLKKKTAAQNA